MASVSQKKWKLPSHYDDSNPEALISEAEIIEALGIKEQTVKAHLPAKKFPRKDGYIKGIQLAQPVIIPTYSEAPVVAFTMDDLQEASAEEEVSEKQLISSSEPVSSLNDLKDAARQANNRVAEKYKSIDSGNKVTKKEPIPEWFKNSIWRKAHGSLEKVQCPVCSLNIISVDSFSAGHILAESKGGMMCSENIIPICPECNSQMGTRHLYWFAWHFYGKALWPVY
jgi:hypothetical protein